jgi:hypothetical protein
LRFSSANSLSIGVAITAMLRAFYGWVREQALPESVFLGLAFVACLIGAVAFDATVVGLTQGPGAILERWDGSFGTILGGVPMPGRIGQYATLLVAWSLGCHLFAHRRTVPATPRAPAPSAPLGSDPDSALAVIGTTVRARDGNRTILLDRDEIDWIAADGDYIRVHCGPKSLLVRATMKHSSRLLAYRRLFVCRSAIVAASRSRDRSREAEITRSCFAVAPVKAGRNYAQHWTTCCASSGEGAKPW